MDGRVARDLFDGVQSPSGFFGLENVQVSQRTKIEIRFYSSMNFSQQVAVSIFVLGTSISILPLAECSPPPTTLAVDVVVSPVGSDAATGTADQPLRTLDAARLRVRQIKAEQSAQTKPIVVLLQAGTYPLTETLTFGPDDSGTKESPVVYRAAEGAEVVVSGGTRIEGFTKNGNGWWQVELPEVKAGTWYFSSLHVNGQRRYRPVWPTERWGHVVAGSAPTHDQPGQYRFTFGIGDIPPDGIADPSDVEVVNFPWPWVCARQRIVALDRRTLILQVPTIYQKGPIAWSSPKKTERFRLDNVREALGRPGQWYLERKSGMLTYIPMPGEEMDTAVVVAPRLQQIVRFAGEPTQDRWVEHLRFEGIHFAHTDWSLQGASGAQQADADLDAAVMATGLRDTVFAACSFSKTGAYAIEWSDGCRRNRLLDCDLYDLGGGGIKIGGRYGGSFRTFWKAELPDDERRVAGENEVSNCTIAHGGRIHPASVGVWIGHSPDNLISRCEIKDFFYSAVSVGWEWVYGKSFGVRNTVEFNRIADIGQNVMSDLGGVYTLGESAGTVIRNNFITDVNALNYNGNGLYHDQASTGIVVENNVVLRTSHGGFVQHFGRDNVIRNNIFANGRVSQVIRNNNPEFQSTFRFERNIVIYSTGTLLDVDWKVSGPNSGYTLDHNVYWDQSGRAVTFFGKTLSEWQAAGNDAHSVVADPLFANPAVGDFTLAPQSPALSMGFQRIDLSKVGRQSSARRPFVAQPPPPVVTVQPPAK